MASNSDIWDLGDGVTLEHFSATRAVNKDYDDEQTRRHKRELEDIRELNEHIAIRAKRAGLEHQEFEAQSQPYITRELDDIIAGLQHLRTNVYHPEQAQKTHSNCCDKLRRQVKEMDERLKAVEQAVSRLKGESTPQQGRQQNLEETWASPTLSARQDSHKKPAQREKK